MTESGWREVTPVLVIQVSDGILASHVSALFNFIHRMVENAAPGARTVNIKHPGDGKKSLVGESEEGNSKGMWSVGTEYPRNRIEIVKRASCVGHCCLLFLLQKKQEFNDRIISYVRPYFCYVYLR